MEFTRRDLSFLLTVLTATRAGAQHAPLPVLDTKVYHEKQIPYVPDPQQKDRKKGRRFFFGKTHTGFAIEIHETVLEPGTRTHAPHKHPHDEFVLLAEGMLEAWLDGRRETVEAGSIVYMAGNQMHSVRNAGSTPARYYAIELRGNEES